MKRTDDSAETSVTKDEAFQQILALLKGKAKIDVSQYKASTIGRRILRNMQIQKAASTADYLALLEADANLIKELADDIFIHVTRFFRDPESFDALKKDFFPRLFKAKTSPGALRIWVPGCSTGEEAYSIAISLSEYAEHWGENISFQLFATDISEAAVDKARSGLYQATELESLSPERIERYFDRVKDAYKIKKPIRDLCIFSRHDLVSHPPFARIDLISCRNVLIYFDPDLQKQVMPIFHYSLNPTGLLWLGRSEAPIGISKYFSLIDKTHKVFSKNRIADRLNFRFPLNPRTDRVDPTKRPSQNPSPVDPQKEIDRIGFAKYAPAGAVINTDMEVIQIRGHTAPFLELPAGQPTYNFLKLVRPDLLPSIRMAIQSAKKSNAPYRKEGLTYVSENGREKVDIEVIPVNPQAPSKERQFLIFFEEATAKTKKKTVKSKPAKKKDAKGKKAEQDAKDIYIAELLREIDSMREYQQTVAEGYEAAQEELTSSNEELQSTLEEFQSTNEELETAREEMQATNEELATVNDELHHRNEELAKSEERFRILVDSVKDYAIYMLDVNGYISSWNEGARRLKGYERSEIIGQHFSKFYLPSDIQRNHPAEELKIARETGRYEEEGLRLRKDGSRFWANIILSRIEDANGVHVGFAKVTRDLTERKRAEEELRQANDRLEQRVIERTAALQASEEQVRDKEQQLRTLANSMPQMVWMARADGYIFWYNMRWYEYTGTTPDQMEGWGWQSVHDPLHFPRVAEVWKKALQNGEPMEIEFPIRGANGEYRWFLTRAVPIHDSNGKVVRWFGTNTDIEEQRQIREQLAESVRVRDEFFSIASHELKTPLTSLKLQLQITDRRTKPDQNIAPAPQELAKAFRVALRQVDSMTDLVDTLLDISRIRTGTFPLTRVQVDLSELIKNCVSQLNEQLQTAKMEIDLKTQPGLIGEWDRHRIEQVITNLITNAIKYAPRSRLTLTTSMQNGLATLLVEDSGPGITSEKLPKIFERFERAGASRSVGGLGLGLFIAKRIVEGHQGEISVQSVIGRGTKFRIDLPTKTSPSESPHNE